MCHQSSVSWSITSQSIRALQHPHTTPRWLEPAVIILLAQFPKTFMPPRHHTSSVSRARGIKIECILQFSWDTKFIHIYVRIHVYRSVLVVPGQKLPSTSAFLFRLYLCQQQPKYLLAFRPGLPKHVESKQISKHCLPNGLMSRPRAVEQALL